jgi:quercetin dioxygenase-like cupin family protein
VCGVHDLLLFIEDASTLLKFAISDTVKITTVDYAPGAADPVHRHNASAFVYVLEGSIEMQMKGGEKVTLHPGDTFYEDPSGIHLVGKNASNTEPAKFLVVLVKIRVPQY